MVMYKSNLKYWGHQLLRESFKSPAKGVKSLSCNTNPNAIVVEIRGVRVVRMWKLSSTVTSPGVAPSRNLMSPTQILEGTLNTSYVSAWSHPIHERCHVGVRIDAPC